MWRFGLCLGSPVHLAILHPSPTPRCLLGACRGCGEERKEGESDSWGWGWGWGRVGRSPLQKPLVNLEAGMLSFLANWGIVWRGKSQRACRGPESTVGKSVGPVSIRLSHFLAEFLGGQLPAFSEAFLYA